MRLPLWPRATKPCENPRDTLVRYATAIDELFDENAASPEQTTDYLSLVSALQRVQQAQGQRLSRNTINIRVGIALGLCEAYMKLYDITPPDAPST